MKNGNLIILDHLTLEKKRYKNISNLGRFIDGWLEGIEPSLTGPQPAVLPLNYSHHVNNCKNYFVSSVGIEPTLRD